MSIEVFNDKDLAGAARHEMLGPAYFAARRAAEALMQGVEDAPLKRVVDKVGEDMRQALYTYVEDYLRSDLEQNLQGHIRDMVERTVRALLTGEAWAIQQYPMAQYHDGEKIRGAVAKHGGEPLLMARIADLEKEVARLTESLRFARRDY
jgi:nucleoid DNA-binding protein